MKTSKHNESNVVNNKILGFIICHSLLILIKRHWVHMAMMCEGWNRCNNFQLLGSEKPRINHAITPGCQSLLLFLSSVQRRCYHLLAVSPADPLSMKGASTAPSKFPHGDVIKVSGEWSHPSRLRRPTKGVSLQWLCRVSSSWWPDYLIFILGESGNMSNTRLRYFEPQQTVMIHLGI